jgi:hypothetical protein
MTKRSRIIVAVALAGLVAAAAWGEDEFHVVFWSETTQTIDLGNGIAANVFANRGFLIAKDPSHRLHMANQDCQGTQVGSNEAVEYAGYCTVVPTTGDGGIWTWYQGDQTGGTWGVMRGAGSMQGATGGGTFGAVTASWPDGKAVQPIKGTIKMPS